MSIEIVGRKRVKGSDTYNDPETYRSWQNISELSNFTTGEFGFDFKVIGKNFEGVTSIMFEMKKTGRKTQVTVLNMKNYFIKWYEKAQMRFAPNGNRVDNYEWEKSGANSNLRIYYDISPVDDYLTVENIYDDKFDIIMGIDVTKGKYIEFKPSQGKEYFLPGYNLVTFNSKKNPGVSIDLPVYIYYEKVDVEWTVNSISGSSGFTKFDEVNYAVTIADGEEISILMKDDINKPNNGISIGNFDFISSNISLNLEGTPKVDKFYLKNNDNPAANTAGTYLLNVIYVGLLQVPYKCYNGKANGTMTDFTRNILVYKAHYSKRQ
jgi:hypothetical protein